MRRDSIFHSAFVCFLVIVLFAPSLGLSFSWMSYASDVSESSLIEAYAPSVEFVRPVISHADAIDRDFNGVQDSLEIRISQLATMDKSATFPVVVTLYSPVSNQDLDAFERLGGQVSHVYQFVTYGFAGMIPAANVSKLAELEETKLAMIEYDAPLGYHLDFSAPLIRARPTVWNTYGFTGSPDHSIAILDTGVDDSHPDLGPFGNLNFSRKMVGWYDATADQATEPQDYGEHGTHVAGIATGTGAANNLAGSGNVQTTFTYTLPTTGYGYKDYLDVMNPGVISLNCNWGGSNKVLLRLYNPAGSIVAETSGTNKPLLLNYDTTGTTYPTGRYQVLVGNLAGASGNPFSVIERYPYQGLNDGHNLFTGVAPNSKLVGVKVFSNSGSGTTSTVMAGMDWVIQNRLTYHIAVASMSLSLENGSVDSTIDQKADTMVQNGIVTTVSAGNSYPSYTVGSPGTAAYVITVAATNDQNGITSYSSNGDTLKNEYGLIKPDVAAPGGTFQPQNGNKILSVDSNDLDAEYSGFADRNADDYQQLAGTSMSAPHVAGLAALLVQAFGGWSWTQAEALKVKMIISMTSFETQGGESGNQPPLNRGDKDSVEGYGRVSADAAIEAATMTYYIGESTTVTLGASPSDKKVWARQVSLNAGTKYRFQLSVPAGADYDLYIYNGSPDAYGQPIIKTKSVNASPGSGEVVEYIPTASGIYYVVVKWVSGNGAFILQSTGVEHDVAVVNVVPSASQVFEGNNVSVTVRVRNQGGLTETFNVTTYYNASVIQELQVLDLAPLTERELTFNWDTSGILAGTYIIKAVADTVPGETYIANNVFIDGDVLVKVRGEGDLNGDGIVDILDLVIVGIAFGSKPGDPHWNPDADLLNDGVINIYDLILVARNYGRRY